MKTILVPTDFSKEADYALKAAVVIAQKTGANIQLLHVLQTAFEKEYTTGKHLPADVRLQLDEAVQKVAKKLQNKINRLQDSQLNIKPVVKLGSIFEHVSTIIAHQQIDMIVMGTSGASGLMELLDGSNTERVVRFAKSLVLTIRKKTENFELKNVVLATDFNDTSAAFVNKLLALQTIFGFKLHILYINTPLNYQTTFDIEKKMQIFLKKYELHQVETHIIDDYSPQDGITKFAEKTGADVIAISTHGRSGLAHLLDGSIAEYIVNHAKTPVLTYHIDQ
jgi:nucleotide-binding universal stress UspA family protein